MYVDYNESKEEGTNEGHVLLPKMTVKKKKILNVTICLIRTNTGGAQYQLEFIWMYVGIRRNH